MKILPKIIGLTGTNGAGKGMASHFFQEKGFAYFSLSDIIREEIRKRKKALNRDNLIKTGNSLRKKYGANILARRVLKKVSQPTIIDSIRNPSEILHLKENRDFLLLAIDAPVEIRYQRAVQRGRNESVHSLKEFIAKENLEMTGSPGNQQLKKCMEMADHIIQNDGSLEEFYDKLEKFI